MNLPDCYRLLGLRTGASLQDVKSSYRNLARLYHPDVNPGNPQAEEKFIQITEAYRFLLDVLSSESSPVPNNGNSDRPPSPPDIKIRVKRSPSTSQPSTSKYTPRPTSRPSGQQSSAHSSAGQSPQSSQKRSPSPPKIRLSPDLSETDRKLKEHSYTQLQHLLKHHRFPRAIALVEGLAQRLPDDEEVKQWHGITYQQYGRYLVQKRDLEKARIYLKKALQADPNNRSLWVEVERDFRQMEQFF
jgi:curved DNA-binding protein CbpA